MREADRADAPGDRTHLFLGNSERRTTANRFPASLRPGDKTGAFGHRKRRTRHLYDISLTSRDHTPPDRFFLPGSGGIFRDLHVHDLDLIAWLTDSPIETVQATAQIRGEGPYAEFEDFDTTRIVTRTESGVLASICGSRHDARGHDVRLEVFGSKDAISAGINPRTPLHILDDPGVLIDQDPYTGFIDRFRTAFRSETRSFVDLVLGADNPCPPEAATESLRAAIACEIAVRDGGTITVRDVRDE